MQKPLDKRTQSEVNTLDILPDEAAARLLLWHRELGVDDGFCFPESDCIHDARPRILDIAGGELSKNNQVSKGQLAPEQSTDRSMLECETISDLYAALLAFEGCPLKASALHTVFADGDPESNLMLVGEAPGADEDRLGKPFVGLSGQLLDKMFQAIGFPRERLYITNILPWRPPANRQPTSEEIATCLPFVERHISLVHPKILVLVGAVACKALLRTTQGISVLQGKQLFYESPYLAEPLLAFPLYHPAYLLRSPGQKRATWRRLIALRDIVI